jgi:hypothetical protein
MPERAKRDRNNPVRHKSSESDYSPMEFMRVFPDDAACLDRLWRDRFSEDGSHAYCPRCERERKFHRTKTRASYTCDSCGLHVHPMKAAATGAGYCFGSAASEPTPTGAPSAIAADATAALSMAIRSSRSGHDFQARPPTYGAWLTAGFLRSAPFRPSSSASDLREPVPQLA